MISGHQEQHILQFEPFGTEHYPEYASWFQDTHLREQLGGVNEEWLEHILQDSSGMEYAVMDKNNLVAVVGIIYPTHAFPHFVITNIATHPNLRRKGYAAQIISRLIGEHPIKGNQRWVAYVQPKNKAAAALFRKLAWTEDEDPEDEQLIRFAFPVELTSD